MPIGTSNGHYFENEFDHHAGIEDRRNQSMFDMLKGYVGEQLTTEKLKAIMEHPLAPVDQTMTADEPVIETPLGNDLGLQSIK